MSHLNVHNSQNQTESNSAVEDAGNPGDFEPANKRCKLEPAEGTADNSLETPRENFPSTSHNLSAEEDRSTFPSFRFMSAQIKLGLCAADHPHVMLTKFQVETLAQHVLDLILGPEGQRVKPRFYGMKMQNGYLTLVCGDHTTAAWVRELPGKLFPSGPRLKVVEWADDPKTFIAVGHFKNSENETNSRILRFLEVQNEGLDCSRWRVLRKIREKNSAVRVTFSIDWKSARLLKAKGPLLNYKFAGARFMLKTKRGVRFNAEECEDDDFECTEGVEYFNPHAEQFHSDFPVDFPSGYQTPMQHPLGNPEGDLSVGLAGGTQFWGDLGGDYAARVAAVVEKSKTTLRDGLTSRERFLHRKKNRKKKKKGKAQKG